MRYRDPRREQIFERWLEGPARARPFVPFLGFVASEEQAELPILDTPAPPPAPEPTEPFHSVPKGRRRTQRTGAGS